MLALLPAAALAAPACDPALAWNRTARCVDTKFCDTHVASSAAAAGGRVYVGFANTAAAFDAATGDQLWASNIGGKWNMMGPPPSVLTSPAVSADGAAVFVGADKSLYKMAADSGAQLWNYTFAGSAQLFTSPQLGCGAVFQTCGQVLVAVGAGDGALLWQHDFSSAADALPGASLYTTPRVVEADGACTVYQVTSTGDVVAVDGATGDARWALPVGKVKRAQSRPAVAGGMLYVGGGNDSVVAVALPATAAAAPRVAWTAPAGGIVHSSPSVAGGVVYFGANDNGVHAVDAATGASRWRYETQGVVFSSPTIDGDVLYIGSNDHSLYALALADGQLRWSYAAQGWIDPTPAVAGGVVYFGSDDSNLYAVRAC